MIGRSAMRLMRRHSSKPSIPGIITSTTTSAGQERSSAASAPWPEAAVRTSKPSRVRRRARTESRVGSSSTRSTADLRAGSISNAAEAASHHCNDRRSENHDEDRGKDATDHGEEHFHGSLGGRLFCSLAALDAQLVRLNLENLGDRHAELLGLDDSTDEVVDWLRVRPLGDVAQRVATGAAHSNLGQRLTEFLDERSLHLLDDLRECGVEAKAGLDGDRQKVEGIRQLETHTHCPRADRAAQPEFWSHEANACAHECKEEAARHAAQEQAEYKAKDRERDRSQQLHAHPISATQAARIARLLELGIGASDDPALVAPPPSSRKTLDKRSKCALEE